MKRKYGLSRDVLISDTAKAISRSSNRAINDCFDFTGNMQQNVLVKRYVTSAGRLKSRMAKISK